MKIAVGCDHGAVEFKQALIQLLQELGHQPEDLGTYGTESVDYPDFAARVGRAVASGETDLGLLFCRTGVGMAIAANKIPGVRAVVCSDPYSARMSREHNDANVLCLGADIVGPGVAQEIIRTWLAASFSGGRHERRVNKIKALEEGTAG
ncbi:MAG: ribose 5-phosphate isomerase B [Bacillota bacterium]